MRSSEGTPNTYKSPNKLAPLEVNGVTAVTIGTLAWIVALVVFLLNRTWLDSHEKSHWIMIALSGIALGLLGYRYVIKRSRKLNHSSSPSQSELIQDFE